MTTQLTPSGGSISMCSSRTWPESNSCQQLGCSAQHCSIPYRFGQMKEQASTHVQLDAWPGRALTSLSQLAIKGRFLQRWCSVYKIHHHGTNPSQPCLFLMVLPPTQLCVPSCSAPRSGCLVQAQLAGWQLYHLLLDHLGWGKNINPDVWCCSLLTFL